MYVCRYCHPPKHFLDENTYKSHVGNHRYKCGVCHLVFGTHFANVTHYDNAHPNVCYRCNNAICGTDRNQHLREAHGTHPCDVCLRVYTTEKDNKLHLLNPETHPFRCNICVAEFNSNMDFWYHCFIKHRDNCPMCSTELKKTFSDKLQWEEHLKLAHSLSPCGKCYEVFGNDEEQRHHYNDKHRLRCAEAECQETFPDSETLAKHNHKIITCHICDAKFTTETSLGFHYNTHKHKCLMCGIDYLTEYEKDAHFKAAHGITCGTCHKQFTNKEDLSAHYDKIHSLQCFFCENTFNSDPERDSHTKIAHQVQCAVCGLHFDSSELVEQHRLAVHNLKCDVCCDTFVTIEELQVHCVVKHDKELVVVEASGKGEVCSVCDEVFVDEMCLVGHYRKEHVDRCGEGDFEFDDGGLVASE